MKTTDKERWSNRIMLCIITSVGLIVWNILVPAGLPCLFAIVFFCTASLTGYMYGDKYAIYTKEYTEDSNQKEKWFHICFATGIIPILYVFFLKVPVVGISSVHMFIIGGLIFLCICIVVVKMIFGNCKQFFTESKIVKEMVVVYWIIFFCASFLCLNYYFDYNYKQETVNVSAIKHVDNWKLPIYRTQYVFKDDEGNEHVINHTYVALSELEDSETLTIKSGKGLFGLAYENVYVNEVRLGERLIEYLQCQQFQ